MASLVRWSLGVAATCTLSSAAEAYPFLARSTFLRTHELSLHLVKPASGGVLVPILNPSEERTQSVKQPAFLLGNDGQNYPLSGQLGTKTGLWNDGCGHELAVASLKLAPRTKASGFMVASGFGAESQIKWLPAGRENKEKVLACLPLRKGLELKDIATYSLGQSKRRVYFAQWEAPLSKEAAIKPSCELSAIETVGVIAEDGQSCTELNTLERDCQWLPLDRNAHSARAYEGALILGDGVETWLIFSAMDVESSGHTAIPFIEGKAADPAKIDEVHDSGC